MKRFISILLVIATILSMTLSFAGCGMVVSSSLTVGQWLMMVNEAFGMQNYISNEPYFENIDESNPYFETVQIATEWDVIDKNELLDVDEELKWKEALISLVNVGGFVDIESDEEIKIDYAIDNFDQTIRKYWMNRKIKPEDAVTLLSVAQKQWANKEFDHVVEEVTYKEGVIDLTTGENAIDNYSVQNDVVKIPKKDGSDLQVGDIYVLPSNDATPFVQVNKIETISEDEEYIYITNTDDEIELEDIAQDINVEETFVPTAENAIIYDGNGQVISVGENVVSQMNIENNSTSNLLEDNELGDLEILPLYDVQSPKIEHSFEIADWKINLKYKLDGDLAFDVEVETPNLLKKEYQKAHPSQELTVSGSASINDFKVTNEIDYKLFKLNSATLKVDYKQELKGQLKFSGKPVNKLLAPDYQNTGSFAKNWANKVWKDADAANCKGAKTIKICSVDVYTVGVARVCLDINFTISAEGSVAITVTISGTKGIEYKNGNMRLINTCDKNLDVDLEGKVEATIGVGPALYVVGLKKPIIGLQVSGGLGVAMKVKFNIVDSENHLIEDTDASQFSLAFTEDIRNTEIKSSAEEIKKVAESQGCTYSTETSGKIDLHFDYCVDISVYLIVRVSITDTSYISQLLGGKITTSWEVFGEKNGKFLTIHNDNGKFDFGYLGNPAKCTLEYAPFEKKEETEETSSTEDTDDGTILEGDTIILNQMYADIESGGHAYIQIVQIPKGYSTKDLVCSSSNEYIAKVSSDGVITGVNTGSAVITISTEDKKYSAYVAVTVTDAHYGSFEPLNSKWNSQYKINKRVYI